MPRWPSAQAPVDRATARTPSLDRRRNRASTTRVSSKLKMGESSKMELTHPKLVASSARTLRRCVKHIAEGGRSERVLRDERSGPFDPGDCPGAGRVPQHGTPVPEVPGGHASQAAAAAGVWRTLVHNESRGLDVAEAFSGDSRFGPHLLCSSPFYVSSLPCGSRRRDAEAFSTWQGCRFPWFQMFPGPAFRPAGGPGLSRRGVLPPVLSRGLRAVRKAGPEGGFFALFARRFSAFGGAPETPGAVIFRRAAENGPVQEKCEGVSSYGL